MSPRPRKSPKSADAVAKSLSATDLASIARGLIEGLSLGGLATIDDLLDRLRGQRLFVELSTLVATLERQGIPLSSRGLRLQGQALLELGRFAEAKQTLERIVSRRDDPNEVLEAHGLLARIQKQAYLNRAVRGERDPKALRSAIDQYLLVFEEHPQHPIWHGINAAALLARGARDRVAGLPVERASAIAREVRDALVADYSDDAHYWYAATIGEAQLVLGNLDAAELWFHRAAWSRTADAFLIASTLRQLREVWLMAPTEPPGSRILPPLDARMLSLGRTHVIAASAIANADRNTPLEKVFGTSPFMPFEAWAQGLECARSVCRVEDQWNQGWGTGFIVDGKHLHDSLPDEPLLVTNAHVLSERGDLNSLTPSQSHVTFYAVTDKRSRPHTSKIKKLLWSSPVERLDTVIARLEQPPKVPSTLPLASRLPEPASKECVYLIGHPLRGGLTYSLNDNELLDHGDPDDHRVHYRTPSEPGSSGSPVFNANWELIALHHAGDALMPRIRGYGTYQANEGIAFKHIAAALAMR